jgi:hypothetical protein
MATVGLEGLSKLKSSETSSGTESAAFQLEALCLNQLLYGTPPAFPIILRINIDRFLKQH